MRKCYATRSVTRGTTKCLSNAIVPCDSNQLFDSTLPGEENEREIVSVQSRQREKRRVENRQSGIYDFLPVPDGLDTVRNGRFDGRIRQSVIRPIHRLPPSHLPFSFQGTAHAALDDAAVSICQDCFLHRPVDLCDQPSKVRPTIARPLFRHTLLL